MSVEPHSSVKPPSRLSLSASKLLEQAAEEPPQTTTLMRSPAHHDMNVEEYNGSSAAQELDQPAIESPQMMQMNLPYYDYYDSLRSYEPNVRDSA